MKAMSAVNIMRRLSKKSGASSGDVCPTTPTSKGATNGVFT